MGFKGPGVYEISSYQAPTLTANAWDGKMAAGAVIKTYDRGDKTNPSTNALWQLALVAGTGDNAVYLIINVRTGYFLTVTASETIVSTPQISPTDESAHWTIKSTPSNGYDVYTINSKISSRGQLTVKDSSTKSGADILASVSNDSDNAKWYLDNK
ncbi:sclerotinia Sclerotiorum agglutinin Ssa in complex with Gal-Beta1,3-Galnac [Xylariales sp. AK1849]|nr:sclerotinia Sclerotiorum agglutinin Ssa in complex with Gal-Beta1,3-Galnac [Xylariales sp. AK1849]